MHQTKRRGIYLITGEINFDHLVKVVFVTLSIEVTTIYSVINIYLGASLEIMQIHFLVKFLPSVFNIPLVNLAFSHFCEVYLIVIFSFPLLSPSFQFGNWSVSVRKSHFSHYIYIQLLVFKESQISRIS